MVRSKSKLTLTVDKLAAAVDRRSLWGSAIEFSATRRWEFGSSNVSPLSQALSSVLCCRMVGLCSLLLVLLAHGALWAGDIPQLKAKMGPPLIDDLMGGCSLTCAFPWDAVPDDSGSSKISALNDSSSLTAWTSARVGDRLVFKFSANLPRELNGTPFYGIDIANGRIHPESSFRDLGRVKRIRLSHNGRPLYTIQLVDTRRWQKTSFPDIYLNIGDTLALEIMEVYPGKTGSTAAITEIVLQGAH